eukprot:1174409-Prorocentrum_minimum.AAC.1
MDPLADHFAALRLRIRVLPKRARTIVNLWNMLSSPLRLVPTPGICSLVPCDWCCTGRPRSDARRPPPGVDRVQQGEPPTGPAV